MTSAPSRRFLAVVTTAALIIGVTPTIADGDGGALSGRIFAGDATAPLEGAVLKAAHLASETVYDSGPTDRDGRFRLRDLPAGAYELAVATEDGLYPTRATFVVENGRNRVVSLAIAPGNGEEDAEVDPGEAEDEDEGGFWDRTWVATGTIVAFAAVLGVAADELLDDNEPVEEVFASPSSP